MFATHWCQRARMEPVTRVASLSTNPSNNAMLQVGHMNRAAMISYFIRKRWRESQLLTPHDLLDPSFTRSKNPGYSWTRPASRHHLLVQPTEQDLRLSM